MKKQIQLTGERKWWGSDWVMTQDEVWKVLEGWLGQYAQACILSGCVVTGTPGHYNISAGIIIIKDAGGVYQYAQFAGVADVALNGYLIINTANTNIIYEDGNSKLKLVTNTATFTTVAPGGGVDFVLMKPTGGITWRDVTGLLMNVTIGNLATGHAVKFDKDRSEMFSSVNAGAIHITFDFANAVPGSVTRMRFTMVGGNSLIVDTPAGSTIIKDDGDLSFAPSSENVMYFIYAGINEAGNYEVSYVIKQV